jgi:phenylalanyl-tRNA synthetase alpha chain
MLSKIEELLTEAKKFSSSNKNDIDQFRIKYLSKKGSLSELFKEFRKLPSDQKKLLGKKLNELKNYIQQKINLLYSELEENVVVKQDIDLTLPGDSFNLGSRHPISIVRNEIIEIFTRLGFIISEGPEIEDDAHVFSKLNFPPEHPARDMQDTIFIKKDFDSHGRNADILLRTHTSSVQVRVMENQKPPIRTISPGRVFRNESISARAHCIFHQIEGLYIDDHVSFADLKQTLLYFAKEMFGEKTIIRLRPSFFPFTEPSAEMDISCKICGGKGCTVCKHTGWVEILGCGMVDPNVLEYTGIDCNKFTGFAFGIGIERVVMLKYQIKDIRLFFENDVRFLKQFTSAL